MSKDGGPAFPRTQYANTSDLHFTGLVGGISRLDYFAAAALTGMLCNGFMPTQAVKAGAANKYDYVMAAYVLAEAMLAESERRKP